MQKKLQAMHSVKLSFILSFLSLLLLLLVLLLLVLLLLILVLLLLLVIFIHYLFLYIFSERGLEETPPEPFEDLSLLPVKEADSSDEEESRTTPISHSSHPPHAFPVELPPCKPPLGELSHICSREESPEKPDTQLPSQSTTLHEGKEGRSEGMADSPKMKYVEARTLVLPNTPLKDNMQMQGGGGQTLRDHMEFLDDDIDGVHSADEVPDSYIVYIVCPIADIA